MSTLEQKREALKLVADAASIHSDHLRETLKDNRNNASFNAVRGAYVSKLNTAIGEVQRLRLDETLKVSERVSDLNLEDAVDLLHAVEDHIRKLRGYSRPDFL